MTFINQALAQRGEAWRVGFPPTSLNAFYQVIAANFGIMKARLPRHHRVRGLVHPASDQAADVVTESEEKLRAVFQRPPARGRLRRTPKGRMGPRRAAGRRGAGLRFVLGKAKFFGLLAGLFKFKTLATMRFRSAPYAVEWGWLFAAGFVLLIFVHEMGHAHGPCGRGYSAGAPVFIPFVGAFIACTASRANAAVEARVAMAGPIAGSFAAWAVLWGGHALELPL
jgi:hypothetical protein